MMFSKRTDKPPIRGQTKGKKPHNVVCIEYELPDGRKKYLNMIIDQHRDTDEVVRELEALAPELLP